MPGGTTLNVGEATIAGKSVAGRVSRTVTSSPDAVRPSKSWPATTALSLSPWPAGSSDFARAARILTVSVVAARTVPGEPDGSGAGASASWIAATRATRTVEGRPGRGIRRDEGRV